MILGGLLCLPAYAQIGVLSIRTDQTGPAVPGQRVEVCIDADANVKTPSDEFSFPYPVGSYELYIEWPEGWTPTKDTVDRLKLDLFGLPGEAVLGKRKVYIAGESPAFDENRIAIGYASVGGTVPGIVTCLLFEAERDAHTGPITLKAEVLNTANVPIPVTVTGGSLQGVACPPSDLNQDCTVNLADVRAALVALLMGGTLPVGADQNGDGQLDLADIRLLLQSVLITL
jgi:hypothetical protein